MGDNEGIYGQYQSPSTTCLLSLIISSPVRHGRVGIQIVFQLCGTKTVAGTKLIKCGHSHRMCLLVLLQTNLLIDLAIFYVVYTCLKDFFVSFYEK